MTDFSSLLFNPRLLELYCPEYEELNTHKFTLRLPRFNLVYERSLSDWIPHLTVTAHFFDEGEVYRVIRLVSMSFSFAELSGKKIPPEIHFFNEARQATFNHKEKAQDEGLRDVHDGLEKALHWVPPKAERKGKG